MSMTASPADRDGDESAGRRPAGRRQRDARVPLRVLPETGRLLAEARHPGRRRER